MSITKEMKYPNIFTNVTDVIQSDMCITYVYEKPLKIKYLYTDQNGYLTFHTESNNIVKLHLYQIRKYILDPKPYFIHGARYHLNDKIVKYYNNPNPQFTELLFDGTEKLTSVDLNDMKEILLIDTKIPDKVILPECITNDTVLSISHVQNPNTPNKNENVYKIPTNPKPNINDPTLYEKYNPTHGHFHSFSSQNIKPDNNPLKVPLKVNYLEKDKFYIFENFKVKPLIDWKCYGNKIPLNSLSFVEFVANPIVNDNLTSNKYFKVTKNQYHKLDHTIQPHDKKIDPKKDLTPGATYKINDQIVKFYLIDDGLTGTDTFFTKINPDNTEEFIEHPTENDLKSIQWIRNPDNTNPPLKCAKYSEKETNKEEPKSNTIKNVGIGTTVFLTLTYLFNKILGN